MADLPASKVFPSITAGWTAKSTAKETLIIDPVRDAKQIKKTEAELKVFSQDLSNAQKKSAEAKKEMDKQSALLTKASQALLADPTNATKKATFDSLTLSYNNAKKSFEKYSLEVTKLQAKVGTAKIWLDQTNARYGIQTNSSNSTQTASNTVTNAGQFARKEYSYNVGLILPAHFGGGKPGVSLALQDTVGQRVIPTAVKDGLAAFNNYGNSKGIIQMSAETAYYLGKEQGKAGYKGKKAKPYGFKFHYNPNSIGISYGVMTDMSPELLMSGRDKVNPIMPPGTGGFGFELMLNRLEDMSYITEDGNLLGPTGEIANRESRSAELYGQSVGEWTLKEIWHKGTMYDLEYLFRALHGGQGDYKSSLRGSTADQGWLNGAAVEFHLGSNLRYLGRITSVEVTHGVFNSRMVPLISYVSIKAARFYDLKAGKGQDPRTFPITSASGPSGGGGTPRNAVL